MDSEATFGIVNKAEVLGGLLNRDHVHKAGGVGSVCANFSVDFDKTLHDDSFCLARV